MDSEKGKRYCQLLADIWTVCAVHVSLITNSIVWVSLFNDDNSFLNNANAGAPVFAQYLKTKDYPVWKINVYPTGSTAVQIVVILLLAWGSDSLLKGCRWPSILTGAVSARSFEFIDGKKAD